MRLPLACAALVPLVLGATACIPSNVVAKRDRAVELDSGGLDPANPAWRPLVAEDLEGLYRSVRITGDAAASVLWMAYYFAGKDGKYSGAALVTGAPPSFQTLAGRFELQEESILVMDGQRVPARAMERYLELATHNGTVILERAPIE